MRKMRKTKAILASSLVASMLPGLSYAAAGLGSSTQSTTVPEPATLLLVGAGLFGLEVCRRKFRK